MLRDDEDEGLISTDRPRDVEAELFGSQTVREQVTNLLRRNASADYWERLALRYAEVLLTRVEEDLRGIPVEEANIDKWPLEDYENLPDRPEFVAGVSGSAAFSKNTSGVKANRRRK